MGALKWIQDKMKIGDRFSTDPNSMDNNFNYTEMPTTNSTIFQTIQDLKAANIATMTKTGNYFNLSKNDITNQALIDNVLNEWNLEEWWYLLLQANYYANTINYKCSNWKLNLEIKNTIYGAFLYGKAGIFYDVLHNEFRSVLINDLIYDNSNRLIKAKISYVTNFDKKYDFKNFDMVLNGVDLTHLHIFRWGVNSQSAFVFQMPFIRLQKIISDQLALATLFLGKKLIEKVDAKGKSPIEMENFLNPRKFWMRLMKGQSIDEKFEVFEKDADGNLKEIQFYKELESRWYSLFGRKVNFNHKKEREVSQETELTAENFEPLEKNWLDMFKIFIDSLKADVDLYLGEIELEVL